MNTPRVGRSKQAKALKEATRFFFKHAGYSYDPKTETRLQGRWNCAKALARAERFAIDNDWLFEWEGDWTLGCSHKEFYGEAYSEGEPATCETCTLVARRDTEATDEVLASLGCIDDATAEYRRVVEAELALEAMPKE